MTSKITPGHLKWHNSSNHTPLLISATVNTVSNCNANCNSPCESKAVCFYRRRFVCLSVTTITKKIVDGFVPNFMGRLLRGKGRPSLCFVTIGRGMWK